MSRYKQSRTVLDSLFEAWKTGNQMFNPFWMLLEYIPTIGCRNVRRLRCATFFLVHGQRKKAHPTNALKSCNLGVLRQSTWYKYKRTMPNIELQAVSQCAPIQIHVPKHVMLHRSMPSSVWHWISRSSASTHTQSSLEQVRVLSELHL